MGSEQTRGRAKGRGGTGKAGDNSHRFWSLRKMAAPSSGLLETLPMVRRQGSTAAPRAGEAGRDSANYRGMERARLSCTVGG